MRGQPPAAQVPTSPSAPLEVSRLSPREREIVQRLLAGDRVLRIAGSLYLAPSTVRNHLSSTFRKVRRQLPAAVDPAAAEANERNLAALMLRLPPGNNPQKRARTAEQPG